jgi:hypothetical protein
MSCKRASLFIGALLGKLEGVCLREKKNISGFHALIQRTLRFLAIWYFGKGRGLS